MRRRRELHKNLTTSLAVRCASGVLAGAVVLSGCSGSDDGPDKAPEGSTSPSTATGPEVLAGVVAGRVEPAAQASAVQAISAVVTAWLDAAYLRGDHPGAGVATPWPGFTPGAATMAADDKAVTSAEGETRAASRPVIHVDLLGTEGVARAATARVQVAFAAEGGEPTSVTGRVTLVPADGGWQIFGYELARTDPGAAPVRAMAGDVGKETVWILAVGSDARRGQPVLRSRGDAIQLVGLNTRTGAATTIGVPRDSWVPIPGHGSNRVNAALYFGGPQVMGRTVGNLVGVQPDQVIVASFWGLSETVDAIGRIVVNSKRAFSDQYLKPGFRKGRNRINGPSAVNFSRIRKSLPGGDFERSANQQETLRAIQAAIGVGIAKPGFLERGSFAAHRKLETGMSLAEVFRIAQAVASIDPKKTSGCVVQGSIGNVNGASIVFPNTSAARRYGDDARKDATITRC